ncbi:unnamed protein product, partial [Mesorhabditis belari]|uniref:UDP-glucuronosyltransferase n=1 Tax=Mesorhabditis belari TaxID=2138241 RepID=A0AAF3J2I4_9BILA
MKTLIYLFVFVYFTKNSNAKNILIFAGHASKSHWGSMKNLIVSLSNDGHNITLLRTSPDQWKPLCEKCNHYDIHYPLDVIGTRDLSVFFTIKLRGWMTTFPTVFNRKITHWIWENERGKLNHLLHEMKWDLSIVDLIFCDLGNALAEYLYDEYKVPYAFISPSIILYFKSVALALGTNAGSKMAAFAEEPSDPYVKFDAGKFSDRFWNAFNNGAEVLAHKIESFLSESVHEKITGKSVNWNRFFRKASGIFTEDLPKLNYPTPTLQTITNIGYYCVNEEIVDLDLKEPYKSFVNDFKSKGTILIAFGTFANLDMAPEKLRKAFINALSSFNDYHALSSFTDYRIIFPSNGSLETSLSHVLTTSFAPQREILAHPKTKLFISHGGLKSLKESICSEIPLIVLPLMAEQNYNARWAKEWGFAETLNKFTMTKKEMEMKIEKVLTDSSYQKNAQKFKEMLLDNQLSMDKLITQRTNQFFKENQLKRDQIRKHRGLFLSFIEIFNIDLIFVPIILTFVISQ